MLEVHNTVISVAETTPHAVSNLLKNVIKSSNAAESSRIKSRKTEVKAAYVLILQLFINTKIHCEDASWVFEIAEHASKLSVAQKVSVVS